MGVNGVPVAVEAVTRRFGRTLAVDRLTFDVRPGEVLGLLGPNGAGKTTTMRMITGYLQPDEGRILVDGVDLAADALGRKRLLGYVPETSALYPEMTVVGYLRFWAKVRRLPRAGRREAIERAVRTSGLGSVTGHTVGTLSKGYRQRVSIAQALLHDPPVLVLDEPTGALDPRQVSETRRLIERLGRTRTVLLSSHLLSEVSKLCRRVVVLDRGRAVAIDDVASLMSGDADDVRLEARIGGGPVSVAAAVAVVRGLDGVRTVQVRSDMLVIEGTGRDLNRAISAAVVGAGLALVELRDLGGTSLEEAYLRLVQQ